MIDSPYVTTHIPRPTFASYAPRVAEPSRAEFQAFQEFIHREAGISLSDAKRALLVGRLSRRIQDLGLRTFGEYYDLVSRPGSPELEEMLNRVTTNETRFFREPQQFDFLRTRLFPQWTAEAAAQSRSKVARVWSAACSSGEEPYSLAMELLTAFPRTSGWAIDILASDLSTRVLAKAREGVWPIERAKDIPEEYRRAYMLRGKDSEEGRMKAGAEIRSVVSFDQINLLDPPPVAQRFDLIFCRNVLIYFDAPTKAAVVNRLLARLAPGGHLFLGHAESLAGSRVAARPVGPNIYRAAAELCEGAAA